ncbi:MAG: WecB/TagA/CpsF family glycosyltransferase [Treponemataceae bacterium]
MAKERISLFNIPIDVLTLEDFEGEILSLLEKKGQKQIVLLSIWNLLFARINAEYAECLKKADLVLPISKSIITGAAFLKKTVPVKHNPFTTIIFLLGILDAHYKSLYLLGGRGKTLSLAEKNVHSTFPNLQIVGRFIGHYNKSKEKDVVAAIYKATPSLVLLSSGVAGKDRWIHRRRDKFSASIFLWSKHILPVFAKEKKRVSNEVFNRGFEIWEEILTNPLKIFLIIPFIWYLLSLLWCKLFK